MSTAPIRSEFVDVITDSTLLSTTTIEPLTTITTERTIVDTTSNSSSSSKSLTPQQLINQYDTLFTTPDMYQEFVKQKLHPWQNQTNFR